VLPLAAGAFLLDCIGVKSHNHAIFLNQRAIDDPRSSLDYFEHTTADFTPIKTHRMQLMS
jgi:hypothetical protein